MTATLNIRLTGQQEVIGAIYSSISSASPRGPRGGLLYRCSIKERGNGITQLYADLPLEALSDLFGGGTPAAAMSQQSLLTKAITVTGKEHTASLNPAPARLLVDFRRR